jgi:hypothetical protein
MQRRRSTPEDQFRKTLPQIAWKYGSRSGIVLVFIFLVMYYLQGEYGDMVLLGSLIRFTDLGIIKYLNLILIFYSIYRGTRIYKIRHNYTAISYQSSVLSGFLISLYAIIIVAVFSILFYKFIDPNSLNFVMEKAYLNPNTTRAARALNFLRPYTVTFIASFVYTLILSYFLKGEERSH